MSHLEGNRVGNCLQDMLKGMNGLVEELKVMSAPLSGPEKIELEKKMRERGLEGGVKEVVDQAEDAMKKAAKLKDDFIS